jgi:hypothetical protein
VNGLLRPHQLLTGVRCDLSVSVGVRRVPGVLTGLQGYVQPSTHNSTHDDGGLTGQELGTPASTDAAAVSPSHTFRVLEELPMSVRAQGDPVHPTGADTPSEPAPTTPRSDDAAVTS